MQKKKGGEGSGEGERDFWHWHFEALLKEAASVRESAYYQHLYY